ncbi:MAG: symmetrical bis(5'-nucleosyl)-tetraphosphatase [Deltaproteobacteria bacterium]|nr:symmetrical bis(5'-nucleosyl)-tetraphosphatase [Deltaproteobacteria bacterium]
MASFLIGDLQGCYDALEALLEQIGWDPARDRLIFTGDLLNRGGQDLEAARFVLAHADRVEAVLGNHDLHLLSTAAGLRRAKNSDTFGALLAAPEAEDYLAWLRRRPLLLHLDGRTLIHAGLLPEWSLEEAGALAARLGARLRGGELEALVGPRGEGERPTPPWREAASLGEDARDRLALDAFVALRYLDRRGALAPGCTEAPEDAPPDLTPWYAARGRASASAPLAHGHWASLGLRLRPELWSLDGGCVWGGTLCAIRLEDEVVFQARRPALNASG